MRIFFERGYELAPSIWQFLFRPENPVRFEPGQYAGVRLDGGVVARAEGRIFTLTSLPGEKTISFVTKIKEPMSDYKTALLALQPNDPAELGEAMGDFVLPKSPDVPLIFVAGGIGIASYVSMAEQLLQQKQQNPVTLLYVLRNPAEQIFLKELAHLRPLYFVSPRQLTTQDLLRVLAPESLVYLSGSQQFVENLRHDLLTAGVENYRIIFEYYTGYADL